VTKNQAKELNDYVSINKDDVKPLFTDKTKAIVWGMQNKAVQSMLDFDHVCSRKEPSVVAMIYPFT
jgi:ATP citrate (pro-S)-lyase